MFPEIPALCAFTGGGSAVSAYVFVVEYQARTKSWPLDAVDASDQIEVSVFAD